MIYLYDEAIAKDLEDSFNPDHMKNLSVRVIDPEGAIDIVAQIQNDKLSFPAVVVNRNPDYQVDRNLTNFTRMHNGVVSVLDPDTNNLYYEQAVPVELKYGLTILATNTADMDELVRELLFKYTSMYFLTITIPYEGKRKIRFGVTIDRDSSIDRSSGTVEYLHAGTLYQAIVPLRCEGCVLVNYTPAKLRRTAYEIEPVVKKP